MSHHETRYCRNCTFLTTEGCYNPAQRSIDSLWVCPEFKPSATFTADLLADRKPRQTHTKLSPIAKARIAAAAKARWAKCRAAAGTSLVPSVPSVPLSPAPTLLTGDDQAVAAKFKELFTQAEDAKFRVAAFGIYATHVKLKRLKHNQFGDWVRATLGAEHYRSVRDHMQFAKSTLERIGYPSLKAFFSKWQSLPICHSGEFLLLPDAQVPAEAKPIREKVFSLFAGKSKYQLCSEWKQVEEDESGNKKVKVGRLKGQGGATKAQRDAKKAADAKADKVALELATKDFCRWVKANCVDDKIGTKLSDAALQAFNDWCKVGFDYSARILTARKQGPAA